MAIQIENPETFWRAVGSGINLFLGAGFSALAKNEKGEDLPTGEVLASVLRSAFSLEGLQGLGLNELCTIIASAHREELRAFLMSRFTVGSLDERYRVLDRIAIDTIFTTNIDNLVHRAYENSVLKYVNDLDLNGPVFHDKAAVELVTLHGSVMSANRPLRFGALDVASSFSADPNRWRDLQNRLRQKPILVWGCSMKDAPTLEALAPIANAGKGASQAWIVVRPGSLLAGGVDFLRALNLQIIDADTDLMLTSLVEHFALADAPREARPSGSTHSLFPSEDIPRLADVPVRPVEDFFRGSSPTWSDIFSGSVWTSSRFADIREAVYAGRHTIITGVPACGKSTLLMQLAAHLDFEGHKLIMDNLTEEKAQMIIRRVGAGRALVFVDNCTDDAVAFTLLANSPAIRLVGADTDYNVSNTMHLIPRERFFVVDITPLSDQDIQSLRESIPERIRVDQYVQPDVTAGVHPSIFEFVQANIAAPTLKERVVHALREFRHDAPDLAETLLVIAYVHHCHTPLSMDMAFVYWAGNGKDYQEVYDFIRQVGASITEYQGLDATESQDYFAARSTLVADVVLTAAEGRELRDMLLKFHERLGLYTICNYSTFSRRAYDDKLIRRAFVNAQEGRSFYDKVFCKDPSPYVLQQAALYLSAKGCHNQAFGYIDRALTLAGNHNWTIRNSHAIIMFRANIHFSPSTESTRQTLDDSMSTLTQCYKSDRRKSIHAVVFAEHSVQYWDKYSDDKARSYLEQAKKWLAEEKMNEPWQRRIGRLQTAVDQRLSAAA